MNYPIQNVTNSKIERHVVLVEPQVPWNTGNIGRTCLGTGACLHLIKPLGFSLGNLVNGESRSRLLAIKSNFGSGMILRVFIIRWHLEKKKLQCLRKTGQFHFGPCLFKKDFFLFSDQKPRDFRKT